ncbi:MAG: LacI family DNA-binding transcriptional regulator [Lachnotalea sp.]
MRIKSKDIAQALGISPATVSLVINNKPGVKAETKKKVQSYIEQLELRNSGKISVESQCGKGTVLMLYYIKHGFIMNRKESASHSRFFKEIEYQVNRAGYRFLYEEFYEKKADIEESFSRWKKENVRGIYIMAAEMNRSDIYLFQKLDMTVVVGDNLFYDLGMDSFLVDNKEGIIRGVDYLVDRGHSHIVYLAENTGIFNFLERREAFVSEMAKRQCGDSSNRIRHLGNTVEDVYNAMNKYLDEGLHKTSAFVLESSVISLGVSKALLERNMKVPRDISLVGFDALPKLSIPGLNLTLIKGTHSKRHEAAIKHLLQHLVSGNEEEQMVRVYYRTKILEGDSVFDKTKYIYS